MYESSLRVSSLEDIGKCLVDITKTDRKTEFGGARGERTLAGKQQRAGHFTQGDSKREPGGRHKTRPTEGVAQCLREVRIGHWRRPGGVHRAPHGLVVN